MATLAKPTIEVEKKAEDADMVIDIDEEEANKKEAPVIMLSKLEYLIRKLRQIRAMDPTAKVLVFSQFNQTLEWLQSFLPTKGFQFRTLRGDMTMAQRKKSLDDFQQDPPTTIFLLSMRAGLYKMQMFFF